MSSAHVRTEITSFLTANSAETNIYDLTAEYRDIRDVVGSDTQWLGLQFFGDSEVPIGLTANNSQGCYRELGSVFLHVVQIAETGVGASILTRGEALRTLLRGQTISGIVVEEVTPLNFESGATLQFDGGFMSATFLVGFRYDLNL